MRGSSSTSHNTPYVTSLPRRHTVHHSSIKKLLTAEEQHCKAKPKQQQECVGHNEQALAAKGEPAHLDVTTAVTVMASACLNTDWTRVTSKAHKGRFRGSLWLQERSRDPPLLAVSPIFFALHILAAGLAACDGQRGCGMGVSLCMAVYYTRQ